jgi:hypothetical protein
VSAAKKSTSGHGVRGRLPRRREIAVYSVLGALWLSGVAWLVLRYFLRPAGELGELPHPLEPWTMRVHGLVAFAALWLLGQLWIVHIVPSWRAHRRNSGILLSALMSVLLITGWLLYYATGDRVREIASLVHWTIGLALVVPLLLHSLRHRSRRWRD